MAALAFTSVKIPHHLYDSLLTVNNRWHHSVRHWQWILLIPLPLQLDPICMTYVNMAAQKKSPVQHSRNHAILFWTHVLRATRGGYRVGMPKGIA